MSLVDGMPFPKPRDRISHPHKSRVVKLFSRITMSEKAVSPVSECEIASNRDPAAGQRTSITHFCARFAPH